MTKIQNSKKYDLEERSLIFAKRVREFITKIPKSVSNVEDIKQLVRSSGSIGANYIEVNESLGKKDFYMRIKICRKEAKETQYWLKLLDLNNNPQLNNIISNLVKEAKELMMVFGAIVRRVDE